MGESVEEATITTWNKKVGDFVDVDDIVVEVATDKVDSEIPSEISGVVKEILFQENEVVKVGQVMAIIELQGQENEQNNELETQNIESDIDWRAEEKLEKEIEDVIDFVSVENDENNIESANGHFYSPLVKTIAQQENINQQELDKIKGTGLQGRVTKEDILKYVERKRNETEEVSAHREETVEERQNERQNRTKPFRGGVMPQRECAYETENTEKTFQSPKEITMPQLAGDREKQLEVTSSKNIEETFQDNGKIEILEMSRMGKLVSKYMTESKRTSAHVQSFIEVDMTRVWNWRNKVKAKFESREGEKLTFTPIFIEAVAKALADFPMMNVSTDGEKIFRKKYINIGMATALPNGDLIVPVIKDADQKNLVGLAKAVNDLAERARKNKLKPDEVKDGTYTVTNIGSFGTLFGTPIINQPEVGILAIGAIQKVPAVVQTPEGDTIAIRYKLILSHSYDHRVVNGALGGMFVQRVAKYLENWDMNREI